MTHGNSTYTPELAQEICDLLVCGDNDKPMSLRAICRMEGMPSLKTVMRWLAKDPEFRQQYAHAREIQQESNLEEILEIADNCTDDVRMLVSDEDESNVGIGINASAIARAKLRVDTRKWAMSKLAPKKYGDKIQQEHSGNISLAGLIAESQKDA